MARHEKYAVKHSNWLKPEDYLRFIHFKTFERGWADLRLGDDDLRILQLTICLAPLAAPVMPGCGGVRKMRFAPPSWKKGKSGALRVLYAVFPEHAVCVLAAVYAKSDQENITPADKRALKLVVEDIPKQLAKERKSTST